MDKFGHIFWKEIGVCDKNVGGGWEGSQQIFDHEAPPNVKIDDDVLLAQNGNSGGIMRATISHIGIAHWHWKIL